jgi:hypothetical protein
MAELRPGTPLWGLLFMSSLSHLATRLAQLLKSQPDRSILGGAVTV